MLFVIPNVTAALIDLLREDAIVIESPDRSFAEWRVPPLSGALNFRDLGGYRTATGSTIRRNRLYRSGTTHLLTADDLELLVSYGIRHAYDLRSRSERLSHSNRLEGVAGIHYAFFDHDKLLGDVLRVMRQPDARPGNIRALMFTFYRDLPYEFREAYRALFTQIANGDLPLVFNCTVGKDRTGVAAALVLTALGVPRETIYEDYCLTEQFFEQSCRVIVRDSGVKLLAGIDPQIWEPTLRADPAYLAAMFERVTEAHGSAEGYLKEELGIDAAMLERIQCELLEPCR